MTITDRPWTDCAHYKEKSPKKWPFAAGVAAVQVAFRNDSDDSMKINLERIRLNVSLSEEDRQSLYPLTSEQAADVITHPGSKNVTMKRLTIPLAGPKGGHDKKWEELEKSLNDAAVQASAVAPHSTVQGLFYSDLRSQFDLLHATRLD